jgi:drug/metabolite transporter (DMT)-like permease
MYKSKNNFGAGLVLLSALMFGSYGVWSRLIGDEMSNFFQGWTRALLILILIIPIALIRREIIKIQKEDRKWLIVFLVFTSLTQAPLFYAYNHMDIGTATLLFFVSMFLTMNIVGILFFGEKLTKPKIISALLAIAGMYLVFSFSIVSFTLFAASMAILNGIASGGEIAFSKKLTNRYTSLYVIVLSWAIILITNAIISISIGEPQIVPSANLTWLWQICYSVASLLGFWCVIAGFKYIDASVGALIGLLEIIFSIAFGIFIFKESLTLSIALGGLLIIIASALPSLIELTKSKDRNLNKFYGL